MKEQLAALYELQGLDVKIARADAKLASMGGGRELKAKLAAGGSQLEATEKPLHALETELKDCELQLKSIDEKRIGYEKRLSSSSSPKEAAAFEKEVKILKEQQGKLDSRTLELYDQVEAARNKAQSLRKIIGEIEKQLEQTVAQEAADKAGLESELAELTALREAAVAKVTNKQLMARYDAVRRKTGSTGIARVIDGKCEGCRVSLTTFMVRKLYDPKEMLNCESCGRILFIAGEQ